MLNKHNNRKLSYTVQGINGNFDVTVTSFSIKSGETPNEITFRVMMDDRYNENNIPLRAGTRYDQGEVVRISFKNSENKVSNYFFQLTIMNITTRGNERYFTYRGKDLLRLWGKGQKVWKRYNEIDDRDYYNSTKANYGFYWTDQNGLVQFKEANVDSPDFNERLGLIDAYHAIMDIFYSPKREILTKRGNLSNYPRLVFDPSVRNYLSTYILPYKQYLPSDIITAILDILREINNKFTIYSYSNGRNLGDHILLITMLGKGPRIVGKTNTSKNLNMEEFVNRTHNPKGLSLAIIRDELSINTENQIDAVKYKGNLRQYFVRNAWLVPAWKWWEDYTLVVRNATTLKMISPYVIDPASGGQVANPEYPMWMWEVLNHPAYQVLFSYSHVFERNTPTDPSGRKILFNAINNLWSTLLVKLRQIPDNERNKFLVNLCCFDYKIKPDDPFHKYRFKRFIAIPSDRPDLIPKITPQNGWDHPDLLRFKNISDTLVDGRRNDISLKYFSRDLRKSDTYRLRIPVVVESELPNYTEANGLSFGKNPDLVSGTTMYGTPLEWRQIEVSQIEGKDGFFWIQDPESSSIYIDQGTLVAGSIEGDVTGDNVTWYRGSEAGPGQPTNRNDDPRLEYFRAPFMSVGGVTGMTFQSESLYFRARMRATFYFTKEETLRSKYFGGESDPNAPSWYFDQIFPDPRYNDPWLAGIVTPSDIGVSKPVDLSSPSTRYGFVEDTTMMWQSSYSPFDPSATYTVGPDGTSGYWVNLGDPTDPTNRGILQNGLLPKADDISVYGRLYVVLSWPHRDDRYLLRQKAILKLLENIDPQFGGTLETLEMFELGTTDLVQGGSDGIGLGSVTYKGYRIPISGYSTSFPDGRTILEFDTTPLVLGKMFQREKVTNIRAQEILRTFADEKNALNPNQVIVDGTYKPQAKPGEVSSGFTDPHKADKPVVYYRTADENYGKQALNIPSPDMNNAQKVVQSMSSSVLPQDEASRESVLKNALSAYPEMDGFDTKTDSRTGL